MAGSFMMGSSISSGLVTGWPGWISEYIVRAEIESPDRIAELDRDTDEMTLWELSEYIAAMRSQGRDVLKRESSGIRRFQCHSPALSLL